MNLLIILYHCAMIYTCLRGCALSDVNKTFSRGCICTNPTIFTSLVVSLECVRYEDILTVEYFSMMNLAIVVAYGKSNCGVMSIRGAL